MKEHSKKKKILTGAAVALFWITVWQAAAVLVGKPFLFASPYDTGKAFFLLLPQGSFWRSAMRSLFRIASGFFLAFFAGLLAGTAAWRWRIPRTLLSPLLTFTKSVPVASFIILALVWFGAENLAIVISFLIVFPLIYFAVLNGLNSTDPKLAEMAKSFRVPAMKKARMLYRPAAAPYVLNACSSALGMSWKAGIAAEVIGTPADSIGEKLYTAKTYLDTPELFAWTLVVILLSFCFEKLMLYVLRKAGGVHGR